MVKEKQTRQTETSGAPSERGRRNLPKIEEGVSSTTAKRDASCQEIVHLMEVVVEGENMRWAYKHVVANRGSAGIDDMSVDDLKPYLQDHWARIKAELLEGRYQPQPVLRVEIP